MPSSPSEAADRPGSYSSGSTPMPTRLDRWIRSKLSASTNRIPSRFGPFAAQSRLEPLPYSFPANTQVAIPSSR